MTSECSYLCKSFCLVSLKHKYVLLKVSKRYVVVCSVHTLHGVFNRLLWIGGLRWWKNINLDVDYEGGLLSRVRLDVRLISWWLGLADLPILSLFNRRQTPHSFDLEFGRVYCKSESRRFLMILNFNSYSVIAINTMLLDVSVTAILTPKFAK